MKQTSTHCDLREPWANSRCEKPADPYYFGCLQGTYMGRCESTRRIDSRDYLSPRTCAAGHESR